MVAAHVVQIGLSIGSAIIILILCIANRQLRRENTHLQSKVCLKDRQISSLNSQLAEYFTSGCKKKGDPYRKGR